MTVDQHGIIAIVTPVGVTLDVKSATVTLEEGWAPYCQVTLVCALPNPTNRALIDLRANDLRLDLRLRQDFGEPWAVSDLTAAGGATMAGITALLAGQPLASLTNRFYKPWNGSLVRAAHRRFFNLYVTERTFDDVRQELTVIASTDEARLIRDALLTATPWNPGTTSAKAIVELVLNRIGATLAAGASDSIVAEASATIQQPGVTMWDYLDALLQPASLRLWCDENRVWRLGERLASSEASVTITPTSTMTGHSDRMTFDPEIWFDGVTIEYRWVDDLGANQVAYDVAGTMPAKSVRTIALRTRYPGPGAAAGILSRAQGRGRVLDVQAVNDYTLTPGMGATIVPPYTASQTGYLTAVSWQLPAAEMKVTTRGLVEISPDSSLYGSDVTFADVAISNPTLAIQDFDWSLV